MSQPSSPQNKSSSAPPEVLALAQDLLSPEPQCQDQLNSLSPVGAIQCILDWVVQVPDQPLSANQANTVGSLIDNIMEVSGSQPKLWEAIAQQEKWVMLESLLSQHDYIYFRVEAAAGIAKQFPQPPQEAQGLVDMLVASMLNTVHSTMSIIRAYNPNTANTSRRAAPVSREFLWDYSSSKSALSVLRKLLPSPSNENIDPQLISTLEDIERLRPHVQELVEVSGDAKVARACAWIAPYLCLHELTNMTRRRTQSAAPTPPKM